ncbi:MAG TPA: hypothetical protein VHC70_06405, partial [Phycisphaerales bacterium]|nr:hypothetical protein [Phycisphaerales bacterium]
MPIDWFTVVAQAVNFLILVVLMRKFLYGPIRRAVEAREKKIQDSLREAADKYTQAAEHEEALKHRHAELEASRDRMIGEARARAESERQALLDAARRDVDAKRTEWLESFARQRDALAADVGRATSLAACD